jgi:hypothetical protein
MQYFPEGGGAIGPVGATPAAIGYAAGAPGAGDGEASSGRAGGGTEPVKLGEVGLTGIGGGAPSACGKV